MFRDFDVVFGQQLCDVLAAELGFVCNFMGEAGRIVASSEHQRIGQSHAIAARIMGGEIDEYGVSAIEAAQSPTMREGINMGIDVDGTRLISFSIVGPLETVRPLARLIRFCVVSLLRVRQQGVITGSPASAANYNLPDLLSHASDSIENSLTRLRDAVDNIDQGITVFDAEMRLVVWNKRFLELSCLPPALIVTGLPLAMMIRYSAECTGYSHEAIEAMIARRMAVVALCESNQSEYVMPGGVVIALVDQPLPNGGFVSTYTDVTRRHQGDVALRAAYDNAERLVEARTRELRDFAELSADWFWAQDAEFRFTSFWGLATDKLQRKQSDFFGKRRWDMPISGVTAKQLAEHIATCQRHEAFRYFEYEIPDADGVCQYFSISGTPVFNKQGDFTGYHGNGSNITELRLAERAIKNSERHLAQIVDGSSIPTFVIDAENRVTHWNKACVNLTGLAASEMLGSQNVWRAFYQTPRPTMADLVLAGAVDETIAGYYENFSHSPLIAGAFEAEGFYPQMGEGGRWLYFTAAPLRDVDGKCCGALETIQDVTENRRNQQLLKAQAEERIQLLAFSDPLTGLPNRRLLLDRLEHALVVSARSKHHGALFLIDLDDFKRLNDTRGHYIGDLLLKQVAQRIVSCVREVDTVARLGGDEFVVMLEDLSENALEAIGQAESVGAKILTTLNQPYMLQESAQHSTPSIGVTLFGDQQSSLEELLKQADLAMYRAKSSGRNALRFFDPEMQSVVAARVAMEADLRQGLQKNQFILHYQPQVDHTSRVLGAEALVRWLHPLRGMVQPGEFIPLAEETGLILPLGLWVLTTACAQLSAWAKQPETAQLTLAVNVSAHQFRQKNFVGEVLAVLGQHAIAPGKLKLELTESLLLEDVEDIIAKMTLLKASGVGFSLDDFGTGYSSLSYLKRLPLDQLKIDQSFVRDVLADPNDAAIARTIVTLAHSLGLGVIAEGVETEAQLLFLAGHGCHAYQGYLFSRPLALPAFEQFVALKNDSGI